MRPYYTSALEHMSYNARRLGEVAEKDAPQSELLHEDSGGGNPELPLRPPLR